MWRPRLDLEARSCSSSHGRPVTWAAGLDRQHRRFPLFREPASPVSDNMADSRARPKTPAILREPPSTEAVRPEAWCVDARMMLHLDRVRCEHAARPAARPAPRRARDIRSRLAMQAFGRPNGCDVLAVRTGTAHPMLSCCNRLCRRTAVSPRGSAAEAAGLPAESDLVLAPTRLAQPWRSALPRQIGTPSCAAAS